MNVGDSNTKGQRLVAKSDNRSTSHRWAKIWTMQCDACGFTYGSNSCDAHIRKCPGCQEGATGEPLAEDCPFTLHP